MSFDYNYKFWVATSTDIHDILKRQEAFRKLKPVEDRGVSHSIFAELYARYVQLVNKLGYIYHHTLQVQKRDIVKRLLEAATRRLLELKSELKKIELSEFVYVDKVLIQRKLVPQDMLILRPQYFPYWRPKEIEQLIKGPRVEEKPQEEEVEMDERQRRRLMLLKSAAPEVKVVSPRRQRFVNAVVTIQRHDRLRRARVYQTNIRMHPEEYKPKPSALTLFPYVFTHRPDQTMLIPVRRTRFEANYFVDKKDLSGFRYYVKPVHKPFRANLDEEDVVEALNEEEVTEEEDEESELEGEEEQEETESSVEDNSDEGSNEKPEQIEQEFENYYRGLAATRIQSAWRLYKAKKAYKAEKVRRLIILGMLQERKIKRDTLQNDMDEAEKIRSRKEEYDQDFLKCCEDEKARILKVKGPWIMEDITDQIRAWFQEFYQKLNTFHPYPEAAKGGTLLVLKGETSTVPEYAGELTKKKMTKEEKKAEREKQKAARLKVLEKAKKEKKQRDKIKKQMQLMGIYDFADELANNRNIAEIEKTMKEYQNEWEYIDETLNKLEGPIMEWITSAKFAEVHQELRTTVDEMMRIEYELLQKALATDMKKKYKAPKQRRPKSPKGEKKKKAKKDGDLTAERSVASLYYEMLDAGLIRKYERRTFADWVGDYNYCAYDMRNYMFSDPISSKGEVKDILKEYIFGMGPLDITKPKSICLAGPERSGKRLLCDILATEIDAVMIDLSPEVTVQYASRLKYLIHLVTKMARLLQPTIIVIHGAHRVFWKKTPKDQAHLLANLLQKDLFKKIVKPLKQADKIFVIGTTDQPWTAKPKMKKCFEKIVLLPGTDYASSFLLWRNTTLAINGVPRDFDFSALAMVTQKYSSGNLTMNIEELLSIRRRMQLSYRPLQPMEFLEKFFEHSPPKFPTDEAETEKFVKWYTRSSKLAAQRAKYVKQLQAAKEAEQAKKKK